MTKIYSLWISGDLQPVNLLTIRSFKAMGHELIIYSYNRDLTMECEVRDARFILPESEIYFYKNMMGGEARFKFGGIAERLKAEMLYQLGGIHVDLDVTCLKPFDFIEPYLFRIHPKGIVGNVIKAPQYSDFAKDYVEWTKTITADNEIWHKSFEGLQIACGKYGLQKYVQPNEILGSDDDWWWLRFMKTSDIPPESLYCIHWCRALNESYEVGSFYEALLRKYEII